MLRIALDPSACRQANRVERIAAGHPPTTLREDADDAEGQLILENRASGALG
jgi:hypothetical protein